LPGIYQFVSKNATGMHALVHVLDAASIDIAHRVANRPGIDV